MRPSFDVVVPSAGRASLRRVLESLAAGSGPAPRAVIVVLDRDGSPGLEPDELGRLEGRLRVLRSAGRGPAAARNAGWRAAAAEWVAFLDDDVVPPPDWSARLSRDLESLTPDVAASQGRIRVPTPAGRPPTDWERNVAGLETAVWATADMAYRRAVLATLGGFDERFVRAYREDSDLGLRAQRAGHVIVRGERWVEHPVRRSGFWASVCQQAGNADDALMTALHGPGWQVEAGSPRGRRPRHLATAAGGALALAAAVRGRRAHALAGAAVYLAGAGELAWSRIAPGPRDRLEVATMVVTSLCLPATASAHWLSGWARAPWLLRRPGPEAHAVAPAHGRDAGRAAQGSVAR